MGVRGTEMGRRPMLKSVEFSSVPGREGHHLLGQSLRKKIPLFAALFGSGPQESGSELIKHLQIWHALGKRVRGRLGR